MLCVLRVVFTGYYACDGMVVVAYKFNILLQIFLLNYFLYYNEKFLEKKKKKALTFCLACANIQSTRNHKVSNKQRRSFSMALQLGKDTKKPATEGKVVAEANAPVAQVADDVLESKCGTVAFVAPLGDPSKDDTTTVTVNGKQEKKVTPFIVGYRFKALEDMVVPECGTTAAFKKNPMDFKDINGTKAVKAGETFDLTPFETGLLLSPPEFNGKASGGDKEVFCAYAMKGLKMKDGEVATASAANSIPRVVLRVTEGSIKDFDIIPVLNFTTEKGENGTTRKIRTILPGFEKWEPRCAQSAPRTRTGSGKTATKSYSKNAAAFMQMAEQLKNRG